MTKNLKLGLGLAQRQLLERQGHVAPLTVYTDTAAIAHLNDFIFTTSQVIEGRFVIIDDRTTVIAITPPDERVLLGHRVALGREEDNVAVRYVRRQDESGSTILYFRNTLDASELTEDDWNVIGYNINYDLISFRRWRLTRSNWEAVAAFPISATLNEVVRLLATTRPDDSFGLGVLGIKRTRGQILSYINDRDNYSRDPEGLRYKIDLTFNNASSHIETLNFTDTAQFFPHTEAHPFNAGGAPFNENYTYL